MTESRTFQLYEGRGGSLDHTWGHELTELEGAIDLLKCSAPALPGLRSRPSWDALYWSPSLSPRVPHEPRSFRAMCGEPVRFEARYYTASGRHHEPALRVRFCCTHHARRFAFAHKLPGALAAGEA